MAAVVCFAVFSVTACGMNGGTDDVPDGARNPVSQGAEVRNAAPQAIVSMEDMFTDRDLSGEYDEAGSVRINLSDLGAQGSSDAVRISDNVVTLTKEGVYILSGTLQDGMVAVMAEDSDKVWIVLDGASITNSTGAAIYAKSADKIFLTLAPESENMLANGGSYADLDESNIDGVVFAKCDVTVNGSGSLAIMAEEGHGIATKDDLRITGGEIKITAAKRGLSGKDSVRVAGGLITIDSGKDGIHSEHDDAEKGYVYIADGSITITSAGDGISASGFLQIDKGSLTISAGGGSGNRKAARDENGGMVSTKGIKAAQTLLVNDGIFVIDSQDDAMHSGGDVNVCGGEFRITTGDDGIHADAAAIVAGGFIDIIDSYEGIEGNDVIISGGYIALNAADDGINAAGGRDQSGFGGMFGGDPGGGFGGGPGNGGADFSILISGGTIFVNADGDGVDSNGTLTVTGGELYVSGPADNANGALDYDGGGQITGGTVVAAGSAGMAMNFGGTSTQGSILLTFSGQAAGTEVVLRDSGGAVLLSYAPEKAFSSVVVSSPGLAEGGTYIVSVGGNDMEVELDGLIYGNGSGGFGGGHGGGGRGGRDGGPDGGGRRLP